MNDEEYYQVYDMENVTSILNGPSDIAGQIRKCVKRMDDYHLSAEDSWLVLGFKGDLWVETRHGYEPHEPAEEGIRLLYLKGMKVPYTIDLWIGSNPNWDGIITYELKEQFDEDVEFFETGFIDEMCNEVLSAVDREFAIKAEEDWIVNLIEDRWDKYWIESGKTGTPDRDDISQFIMEYYDEYEAIPGRVESLIMSTEIETIVNYLIKKHPNYYAKCNEPVF